MKSAEAENATVPGGTAAYEESASTVTDGGAHGRPRTRKSDPTRRGGTSTTMRSDGKAAIMPLGGDGPERSGEVLIDDVTKTSDLERLRSQIPEGLGRTGCETGSRGCVRLLLAMCVVLGLRQWSALVTTSY